MNNKPKNDANKQDSPLMSRLPKKDNADTSFLPKPKEAKADKPVEQIKPAPAPKQKKSASLTLPKLALPFKGFKFNFGPPFWTIASIISLSINVITLIVILVVLLSVPSLSISSVMNIGNGLLGGLYTNFEKMDNAHITRTIPVNTTIPVKFNLPISQQTTVVLSQDVTIRNARVTVQTGGLNISGALATIVLPQGTDLPITLTLTVPVDTTVPVSLNVNVDIPLNETQLHDPFVGLRNVVQPFYCVLNPSALTLEGKSACK